MSSRGGQIRDINAWCFLVKYFDIAGEPLSTRHAMIASRIPKRTATTYLSRAREMVKNGWPEDAEESEGDTSGEASGNAPSANNISNGKRKNGGTAKAKGKAATKSRKATGKSSAHPEASEENIKAEPADTDASPTGDKPKQTLKSKPIKKKAPANSKAVATAPAVKKENSANADEEEEEEEAPASAGVAEPTPSGQDQTTTDNPTATPPSAEKRATPKNGTPGAISAGKKRKTPGSGDASNGDEHISEGQSVATKKQKKNPGAKGQGKGKLTDGAKFTPINKEKGFPGEDEVEEDEQVA